MTQEQATRYNILNQVVNNPHRDYDTLYRELAQLRDNDPIFFVHLVAWLVKNSKVRDLPNVAISVAAKSNDWEMMTTHRDVAAALIRNSNARKIWTILNTIRNNERTHRNQRYAKIPQTICTEVQRWWDSLGNNWDRVAFANRKYVQDIRNWCHLEFTTEQYNTIFGNERHGVFQVLTELENENDVYERAKLCMENRLPWLVASTFLPMDQPETWAALIETSTSQQLANMWKALERRGAFEIPELKRKAQEKLNQGKKDKRFQATKAAIFTEDEVAKQDYDQLLTDKYSITQDTALLVDKSGSMSGAIDIARRQGRNIALMCGRDVPVIFFDENAYFYQGNSENWDSIFSGVRSGGGTAIGVGLSALMQKLDELPTQLVFITDQDEMTGRNAGRIYTTLPQYVEALHPQMLNVAIVHVGRGRGNDVERVCKRFNVDCTVLRWTGDYTAEENLYKILSGRSVSKYDIVDEILATELPTRRE